jgi:putative ABC transport system permease protein
MLWNYIRVAFRSLLKNKVYVTINALGLGISMACCIAAYLLIAYNIEFDNFHEDEKVSRIFKIYTHILEKNGEKLLDAQAPLMLAPIASAEIAGIERYTRYITGSGAMRFENKTFNERLSFADSTFFDLFDFPLTSGSHAAFKDKNSIFLTEDIARKYFGHIDPVGKMMVMSFVNETEIEVVVGGVLKKIPDNNTFQLNPVVRMEHYMDIYNLSLEDWSDWRNPSTFVELTTPSGAASIGKQLSKYIPHRNEVRPDVFVSSFELIPFKSTINADEINGSWIRHRINHIPLFVFSGMGLLILLIACFNLTNTSIAMTAKRLKEVGVRKAIGAAGSQIVTQFLFETLLTILLSLFVALLMAQIIVPAFAGMWHLPYGLEDLSGMNLIIALLITVFVASLLAGLYPALFSNRFKPTVLLKGGVKIKGTNGLTRTLVAAQFALSVIVLIGGVVFVQNSHYQEQIQFGYDKDMIITVALQGERQFEAMEKAISANPRILSVGVADGTIGSNSYGTPVKIETAEYPVQTIGIGKNYFETMGLRISQGRTFNLENASDSETVIVNEAFLKRTGLKDPLDKIISLHGSKQHIIGVVENHLDNIHRSKEPEPFVFYPAGKEQYITLVVKTEINQLGETQKYLEATWKELFPDKPFESQLQGDLVMGESREINGNLEKIFLFITLLGGVLSVSGIFALASLNIAKRTKEIGIRKALGGSVQSIVTLLNKEFVIILLVAAVAGSAAGYFLINALLDELYAYHIPVGTMSVIGCALLIFVVGIATTSTTILRAAAINPVDTLRNE